MCESTIIIDGQPVEDLAEVKQKEKPEKIQVNLEGEVITTISIEAAKQAGIWIRTEKIEK